MVLRKNLLCSVSSQPSSSSWSYRLLASGSGRFGAIRLDQTTRQGYHTETRQVDQDSHGTSSLKVPLSSTESHSPSFWSDLKAKVGKGKIAVFAPMDEVTDTFYRRTILHFNQACPPHAIWTEFVNCEGVSRDSRTALERLLFDPVSEKNLIAQVWGSNPETYKKVASVMLKRGFKGIDINMGCPMEKVQSQAGGCCSALISDPKRAQEIVIATKEGVEDKIPVSVKTRLGLSHLQTESWISSLLQVHPSLITIHARTAKQMSKPPLHWDEVRKAVQLRNDISPSTLILGNGDISTVDQGERLAEDLGLDGFMIGRGVFEIPQAFLSPSERESSQAALALPLLFHHWNLISSTFRISPASTEVLYATKRLKKVIHRSYLPLLQCWLKYDGNHHAAYFQWQIEELSGAKNVEELSVVINGLQQTLHRLKNDTQVFDPSPKETLASIFDQFAVAQNNSKTVQSQRRRRFFT